MNDNNEKDFLRELSTPDEKKLCEISRKYPALDKNAKKRIAALCEKKLAAYTAGESADSDFSDSAVTETEIYRKPKWYRSPAFAAAASFIIIFGAIGTAVAGMSRNNNPVDHTPSDPLAVYTHETSDTATASVDTEKHNTVTTVSEDTDILPSASEAAEKEMLEAEQEMRREEIRRPEEELDSRNETGDDKTETDSDIKDNDNNSAEADIQTAERIPDISVSRARELMYGVDMMHKLLGNSTAIEYDRTGEYNFTNHDGQEMVRITDSRFTCVDDVRSFVKNYATGDYLEFWEKYALSGYFDDITFGNSDDVYLYVLYNPKSCGYDWTDSDPVIRQTDDNLAEISADYYDFGAVSTLTFWAQKDSDGEWRVYEIYPENAWNYVNN